MRILIGIATSHTGMSEQRRKVQLATWLADPIERQFDSIEVKFFFGFPRIEPSKDPRNVYVRCPDDYSSLTLKTAEMIRFALENAFDRLFKCDDDTYVRPERLLRSGFEQHDYIGWTKGRFYAQGGAGYWLSRRALKVLDREFLRHHSEDAAVGLALGKNGILPFHDERYQPGLGTAESTPPLGSNEIITLHNCRPDLPLPPSDRAGVEHSGSFRRSMYDVHREFWESIGREAVREVKR